MLCNSKYIRLGCASSSFNDVKVDQCVQDDVSPTLLLSSPLNFHLMVLADINDCCLNPLFYQALQNGDFSSNSIICTIFINSDLKNFPHWLFYHWNIVWKGKSRVFNSFPLLINSGPKVTIMSSWIIIYLTHFSLWALSSHFDSTFAKWEPPGYEEWESGNTLLIWPLLLRPVRGPI